MHLFFTKRTSPTGYVPKEHQQLQINSVYFALLTTCNPVKMWLKRVEMKILVAIDAPHIQKVHDLKFQPKTV